MQMQIEIREQFKKTIHFIRSNFMLVIRRRLFAACDSAPAALRSDVNSSQQLLVTIMIIYWGRGRDWQERAQDELWCRTARHEKICQHLSRYTGR